jgi:sarcosine oxidase subunit alpha
LSFEIAAPAGRIAELWDRVLAAGATPYGTEAMHILRAEKGYIMIGEETDGTVIPQDLGLEWAIADKADFIGKRGLMRGHMTGERWRLVGVRSTDGAVIPEGSYAVAEGRNANGQRNVQGRVTSSHWSPTLRRGIALALVHGGAERTGETLVFPQPDGTEYRGEVVAPVFYDPEGERLRG